MRKWIYPIFALIVIAGVAHFSYEAEWFAPGEVVRNVPKNVRSNPGSYRTHYRTVYIRRGGK